MNKMTDKNKLRIKMTVHVVLKLWWVVEPRLLPEKEEVKDA